MNVVSFTVLLAPSLLPMGMPATAKEDSSAEILAVQIRKQGLTCHRRDGPEDFDAAHGCLDRQVQQCCLQSALVPKMAAKAERLN